MPIINKSSNLELLAWIRSATTNGRQDHQNGHGYVPENLLTKMEGTHQTMVSKLDALNQRLGERAVIIDQRDECCQDLSAHLRYIHGNFRRLRDLGVITKDIFKEFNIPLTSTRESNTRPSVWRDFGDTIVRVYNNYISRNAPALSPMLLTQELVETVAAKVASLETIAGSVHRVNQAIADLQIDVARLKATALDHTRMMRLQLEFALFEKPPAKRRKIMEGYGYLFGGRSAEEPELVDPNGEGEETNEGEETGAEAGAGEGTSQGEGSGEGTSAENGASTQNNGSANTGSENSASEASNQQSDEQGNQSGPSDQNSQPQSQDQQEGNAGTSQPTTETPPIDTDKPETNPPSSQDSGDTPPIQAPNDGRKTTKKGA